MPSLCPMNMERTGRTPQKKREKQPPFERAFQEVKDPFDPLFEGAVDEGVGMALTNIHKRFEDTKNEKIEKVKDPHDNLEFHNTKHTEDVIRRVELILKIMGANRRRIGLGKLMAAYHDTIQEY